MNEMCLSTGFMNGMTSLFVPNLCLDHDNNGCGQMAPPTMWLWPNGPTHNVAVAKWPHPQKNILP